MHWHILIMAALIGVSSAYYWHVEADWIFESNSVVRTCIGPVDNSIYEPGVMPVYQCDFIVLDGSLEQGYYPPGPEYVAVKPVSNIPNEVTALQGLHGEIFNCTKMDEYYYRNPDSTANGRPNNIRRTVYGCTNPKYYGIRGKGRTPTGTKSSATTFAAVSSAAPTTPVDFSSAGPTKTTATVLQASVITPIGASTNTIVTPTFTSVKPAASCTSGYRGKRRGNGPNGACCSHSDDCDDTCNKSVCGVHP